MDPKPELKHDLSMLLNEELAKQLMPGEAVLVSLPGSFGEAFVVTDKRGIVIRECDTGRGCDIHAYPLVSITGADASASGTGGYIELKLTAAPAEPDQARVYFPAYDLSKFQEAAGFVEKLIAAQAAAAQTVPAAPAAAEPSDNACPQCGARVDQSTTFCAQCGCQLRLICSQCGVSSQRGDKFCRYCGRSMQEMVPTCGKCGARMLRGMTFCTECGSVLHQTCANCGSMVVEGWKYCSGCGRQLGSGYVNPRTAVARRIQSTLGEAETASSQAEPVIAALGAQPPQVTTGPAAPEDASKAAEQRNQRGRELFENEDVEGAIREFKAAVELDPGNASYHCNLAVALDENDQDGEALAEYENTLRLDPNDLTALLSLGYMYNENEEIDKAKEVWNRVIEVAPDSAEAQEARTNLDNLGQL